MGVEKKKKRCDTCTFRIQEEGEDDACSKLFIVIDEKAEKSIKKHGCPFYKWNRI